jgi:hypothetical protein
MKTRAVAKWQQLSLIRIAVTVAVVGGLGAALRDVKPDVCWATTRAMQRGEQIARQDLEPIDLGVRQWRCEPASHWVGRHVAAFLPEHQPLFAKRTSTQLPSIKTDGFDQILLKIDSTTVLVTPPERDSGYHACFNSGDSTGITCTGAPARLIGIHKAVSASDTSLLLLAFPRNQSDTMIEFVSADKRFLIKRRNQRRPGIRSGS